MLKPLSDQDLKTAEKICRDITGILDRGGDRDARPAGKISIDMVTRMHPEMNKSAPKFDL